MISLKIKLSIFHFITFPFVLFYILIFTTFIYPQSIQTSWKKTFGGTNIDAGSYVIQLPNGNFAITGYTRSYGSMAGRNVLLLKTDANGNELYINGYGGTADDEGFGIVQTSDGGFVITGYTKSYGAGLKDVVLIKIDSAGNQVWLRTFGGSSDDEGYSIQKLPDGGFIIAGATSSSGAGSRDVYLLRTDANGFLQWAKTLGGMSSDGAWSIALTNDGGYIITGWTFSYGPGYVGNAWLVKTDSLGNQQWHKYFGGSEADRGYCVQQTMDKGYIITGYTASSGAGLDDLYLIKTDSLGNEKWIKTFGGTGRDYGNFVVENNDGSLVITGYTLSFGAGSEDVWLLKTDANGNKLWDTTFGGTASDVGSCVKITQDGGYIITGYTLSYGAGVHDIWLIKTEPEQTAISTSLNILAGWNLISIPLNTTSMKIDSLFPDATSLAYYYDNGYIPITYAQIGKGFWIKFNSSSIKNIYGTQVNSLVVSLNSGWNLIGPLNNNIPVSIVTTTPPGILSSSFYGYQNGYQVADTLKKGKGYWIKASSNGTLTIPILSH